MEDLTERDLGVADDEWTAFALYLLSHPANPDQVRTLHLIYCAIRDFEITLPFS